MKEKILKTDYNGELTLKRKREKVELRAGEKIVYSRQVGDSKYSGGYWDRLATVPEADKASDVLIIGVGCGTVARTLKKIHDDITVHGVEIDRKVTEIGRRWFSLEEYVDEIFLEDGEDYLDRNKRSYDYIIMDCFVKSSVPLHMRTPRFMNKLKKTLPEEGTLSFNTIRQKETMEIKKNMKDLINNTREIKVPKLRNTILVGRKGDSHG